jgi:chromosome segregation ATPase
MPVWVLRNLPFLLLFGTLAGSVWWVTDLFRDRQKLRSDLAHVQKDLRRANAELQRAADTAQIHRAHLERAADEARHWAALSNELELMEGRDAPLSALLGVTAERLYGARQ